MAQWTIPSAQEMLDAERWDAEAFSPLLCHLDVMFRDSPRLVALASVTHPAEIPRSYTSAEGSKRFLLAQNIRPVLPDLSSEFRIASDVADAIPGNRLRRSDVLVTRTGANSGMAAVYLGEDGDAFTSGEGIIVRSHGGIDGKYLAVLLSTRVGVALCRRAIYGSGQPHIAPRYLEQIPIPRLEGVETQVGLLVSKAHTAVMDVSNDYQKAERKVLASLGLNAFQAGGHELTFASNFSACFDAGRTDAEFFRPSVQAVLAHLRKQRTRVRDIAVMREEIFSPQHSSEFHYIEIGGVLTDTCLVGTKLQGHNAPSRAKYIVHKDDVITSTVRPLRRLSGIIGSDQDGWVCSSGFVVLQPMKVPAEYLVAYLRLGPVCELMDAHTTASMYPALSVTNLLNLPVSVPPKNVLEEMCDAVRKVRSAREAANNYVIEAKRIVERALGVMMRA